MATKKDGNNSHTCLYGSKDSESAFICPCHNLVLR